MAIISDNDKKVIAEMFNSMKKKVVLAFFTEGADKKECPHCKDTQNILEELSTINEHIELKIYDFEKEKEKAQLYGIDKIPAITILGDTEQDYGIKFYGIPAGYEFGTFIEDIVMVGKGESGLSDASKEKIKTITKATHIQVFVTPT